MRLFLALPFPALVRIHLDGVRADVMRLAGADLKEAGEPHITLKFFGEVSEDRKDVLVRFLRDFPKPGEVFSGRLEKIGWFRKGRVPTAIWVGVNVTVELFDFQRRLEDALHEIESGFGFLAEHRFVPHATLARVKSVKDPAFVDNLSALFVSPMSFSFDRFVLMQSRLSHGGALYEVLEEFPLR